MDDEQAIRHCLAGDWQAFQHLVRRYQARALAHARAITGNDADAADAAQAAFLDAFKGLRSFEVSRGFYPWFYSLLRNRCLKQRSRHGTRWESAPLPDREAAAARPEEVIDLQKAIRRLPPEDGELILLKHLEGWTYEELSTHLGIPRGTVMSRLFAARRKLQLLMSGDES